MDKLIQVTKSSMPPFEDYLNEIQDMWETHWLTNAGVKYKKLEALLGQYLQLQNSDIVLFANGHLALECVIAAFGLTGEVITTPFSFASTTHAIVRNGLTPVFCDIDADNYTIDVHKLEALITADTSAILPVHVYGNVCNMDAIENIAKQYNLKVIYDAAHAFGITVDGKSVAQYGDASMFSFHATKVFHTIEGGAICFKEKGLKSILNSLKNFGITESEEIQFIGGNAKMNEFQAAMGICNLRYVEDAILKRKAVVAKYQENLRGVRGIKIVQPQEGVKSNYSYFPIVLEGYKLSRDEVHNVLKHEKIFARKYFYPTINNFPCYKSKFMRSATPIAEYISERILTLPLYADLSLHDVDEICNVILR